MWKLTSWRLQICATYWGLEFLNGSYCCLTLSHLRWFNMETQIWFLADLSHYVSHIFWKMRPCSFTWSFPGLGHTMSKFWVIHVFGSLIFLVFLVFSSELLFKTLKLAVWALSLNFFACFHITCDRYTSE